MPKIIVKVIVENVVTCFFGDTMYNKIMFKEHGVCPMSSLKPCYLGSCDVIVHVTLWYPDVIPIGLPLLL